MTVCDRGERGSKIIKNSVTYFMDGPFSVPFRSLIFGVYSYRSISIDRATLKILVLCPWVREKIDGRTEGVMT